MGEDKSKDGETERELESHGTRDESTSSSRGSGGLLTAIGILTILTGGALASLQWTMPEWSWITGSAAKYGVPPGALVLTGMVLFGLGSVSRTARKAAAGDGEESDEMLILEQLVLDFTKLRDGLQELRPELASLKESTSQVLQGQKEHAQAHAGEGQQDAIFRLAASLDQVGARIEQRLTTLNTEIGTALGQVTNAMSAAQSNGSNRSHEHARESGSHPASYGRAVDAAPEADDGWIEIDTGSTRDLGLLDAMDDQGQIHSPKISLHVNGPHGSDGHGGSGSVRHDSAGPLPHSIARTARGSSSGALLGRDAGDGVHRVSPIRPANEAPMGDKLDQLKALLSDARVRRALDLMQSEGQS